MTAPAADAAGGQKSSTGCDVGGRLLAVLEQLQFSFCGLRSAGEPEVPEAIEHKLYAEWAAHLVPPSLAALGEAAMKAGYVQQRLDDAVRRARADGRSWADIGGAVGISRQSAHERWASRLQSTEENAR